MTAPPDLRTLTEVEKDALIRALWAQVQSLTARVAELQARLNQPPKTPGNSSLPPSRGHQKANRPELPGVFGGWFQPRLQFAATRAVKLCTCAHSARIRASFSTWVSLRRSGGAVIRP